MSLGRFVADASVAIAWVHPGQATATTQSLLAAIADGAVFEVPVIWSLEVANALLVLRRRGRPQGPRGHMDRGLIGCQLTGGA